MLLACRRIDQLRDHERVEPWLQSIVLNACKMRLRGDASEKRDTTRTIALEDIAEIRSRVPAADEVLAGADLLRALRRRVARKSAKDLRVLDALIGDSGEDYALLAARCGMTRSAFKTRVVRLRRSVARFAEIDQRMRDDDGLADSRSRCVRSW